MKSKSRKRRWIIISIAVSALTAGAVMAAKSLDGAPPLDASQLGIVETADIARSVVATGKVQPITEVEVKSKASGIVTQLDTDMVIAL